MVVVVAATQEGAAATIKEAMVAAMAVATRREVAAEAVATEEVATPVVVVEVAEASRKREISKEIVAMGAVVEVETSMETMEEATLTPIQEMATITPIATTTTTMGTITMDLGITEVLSLIQVELEGIITMSRTITTTSMGITTVE
jgi:hypothetical protein